jgi:hypothetical protein
MRAIIIAVLLAAVAAAGYFVYQNGASDEPSSMRPQPLPPAPTAADCHVENAVYEYNDDRRLELRFRRIPPPAGATIEVTEFEGRPIGNVAMIVRVTSTGAEYEFTPINAQYTGAQYQSAVTNVQPAGGGSPVQVFFFDSEMHYQGYWVRNDAPAPGYIFMPGILPRLYRDRIDQPAGVFRFQSCATPPAPAAAPAPTP